MLQPMDDEILLRIFTALKEHQVDHRDASLLAQKYGLREEG